MSIDTELQAMRTHISDSYNAVQGKGGIIPQTQSFANLSSSINTIRTSSSVEEVLPYKVSGTSIVANNQNVTGKFQNITQISSKAWYHQFENYIYSQTNLTGSLNFASLTQIGYNGMSSAFRCQRQITSVSFPALIVLDGDNSCDNAFNFCDSITSISLPLLESVIGNSACYGMFTNCYGLTSISLPSLKTISAYMSPCTSMFQSCYAITTADLSALSSLQTISGSSACENMFGSCKLQSISLPSLQTITGQSACYQMFSSCTYLTTASFPILTTATGTRVFMGMFNDCSSLTSVSFPNLTTIDGERACDNMFYNCSSLTSVSFPELTTITGNLIFGTTMFQGCTNLTAIHFRSDMQSTVEGLAGYAYSFGAPNATIYFDL